MGNIKIPYGFNSIGNFRTVKLRISLSRLHCGSSEDHYRRNSAVVGKFYNKLEQACDDAGIEFRDTGEYVRIEGVTTSTKFYLEYKCIMANADACTARLESLYWDSLYAEYFTES